MNASSASNQDIFDVRKIRRLVEMMKEHDLSEIDLQQGEVRIQLRRGRRGGAAVMASRPRRLPMAPAASGQSPARRRPSPPRRAPRNPRREACW